MNGSLPYREGKPIIPLDLSANCKGRIYDGSLPYCEGKPIIPLDLSANCESRIYDGSLPYCEGKPIIPLDLSANCESRIYDPISNGSGNQILGSRSQDPFSGSTDISDIKHHLY